MSKHLPSLCAIVLGLAVAAAAHARPGGCDDSGCGTKGMWQNDIALEGTLSQNLRLGRALPMVPVPGPLPRRCEDWGCGMNGIWQNGVSLDGMVLEGLPAQRVRVILPEAK